jgi:cytochrome c oxidase subunit 3
LSSSFTVALGVNATQRGERRLSLMLLAITVILGLGFLGLKFLEYSHEIENNLFPGGSFNYPGTNPDQAKLFFSLYFVMTGMHALHMVVGIAFVSTVGFLTWQQWITPQRYAPVELAALFWHFVDIVWIFIFPLLYLVA